MRAIKSNMLLHLVFSVSISRIRFVPFKHISYAIRLRLHLGHSVGLRCLIHLRKMVKSRWSRKRKRWWRCMWREP